MQSKFPACAFRRRASWQMVVCTAVLMAVAAGCTRDPQVLQTRALERAEAHAQAGRLAEAVIEYRNAVQAMPQDGEARLKLAEAHAKTGDMASASREYVRAADLLLERPNVQLNAGNLLLLGGRFDDAKVRAEKLLALEAENVQGHILLANALAGLKNFQQAVEQMEEAIRLAPDRGSAYASLGQVEAARGRMDAAERAFRKAVELDTRSVPAHLALANFYWSRQRWADAEQVLKHALAIEPENVFAHRGMATLALGLNRHGEAETHLKAVKDLTGSPEATLALVDFYVARRDSASARQLLEPLTGDAAFASLAEVRLAALDHAEGGRDAAYARLERVLAAEPSNLQALVGKSTLLLSEGRVDDAFAAAQLAVRSHTNAAPAHFALASVEQARHQPDAAAAAFEETLRLNPRATGAHLALARIHLKRGRPADAVSSAQTALQSDPANPDARLALVRGLIAQGDLQRAEPELKRLVAEFPRSAAVRVQNGLLLGRRKDFAGARREFERAMELAPESVEALNGLVAMDLVEKRPDAARARVKDRAERADATPAMLMLAARTHMATGDLETGEQLLRRTLEKDSSYLAAYSALGQIYMRQGRVDAALAEFDALAERDAKPVTALTTAAMILQGQGKDAEARQRYERALAADPTAAVAANNLAWMYAESGGNLDLALQLAQTAYRKLPDSAEVSDTLGFIYYKKDLLPQAVQMLRAAVEKDPSKPHYHYHLGLALARSGDAPGATRHLKEALGLKGDFAGAEDAKAVLLTLRSR